MKNGRQYVLTSALLIAAAAILLTMQWNAQRELKSENAELRRKLDELSPAGRLVSATSARGEAGASDVEAGAASGAEQGGFGSETAYTAAVAALTGTRRRESLAAFLVLLDQMTVENAADIRRAFSASSDMGNQQFLEWTLFWERFGEIGGGAAAEFLADSHGEVWAKSAFRSMLKTWARTDRDAAYKWLSQNPDSEVFEEAFLGFVEGAAYVDTAEATRLALASTANEEAAEIRGKGMKALAEAINRSGGLDAMRGWFDDLPAADESHGAKQSAYGHVYWRLRVADPARAAQFISAQEGTAWQSQHWIGEHARHFTWKSPKDGLDWAFGIGDKQEDAPRASVSQSLIAALKHHPDVLDTWLGDHPDALPEIRQAIPGILPKLDSPEAVEAAQALIEGGE